MSKHVDKIKGGKADKKQPKNFDAKQLEIGTRHEMEHTEDKTLAQEIAMDHLTEDSEYYKKLKAVEKYERVDEESDGKRELDYGKEELEKKPVKKSLSDRWGLIKKDLDNSEAILDLSTLSDDDQENEQPPEEQEADPNQEEQDPNQEQEEGDESEGDDSGRPEWLPDEIPHDDGQGEEEQGQEQGQEQGEDSEEGEQELIEALRDAGHSDAEIAHIVHGHMALPVDEAKRAKAHAEYAGIGHDEEAHQKEMSIRDKEAEIETEHAKRMKDVEYQRAQKEAGETDIELDHKKRLMDLEYQKAQAESQFNEVSMEADHKKRMLDLEYEVAKKQKELELQFKVKEHEMKLKHADELARQKHKDQMVATKEQGKHKIAETKSKLAEKKAEKKKVKKSDEEDDDLMKAIGWKHNADNSSISHPEHGVISVVPSSTRGSFSMIHNGKNLGTFSSHSELKNAMGDYMSTLGNRMITAAPTAKPQLSLVPNEAKSQIESPAVAGTVNTVSPRPSPAFPRYKQSFDPALSGTIDYNKKKMVT